MGVPLLCYYYYKKYGNDKELLIEESKLKELNTTNLFFDYNSLIHPCAQQILSANHDKYIEKNDKDRIDIIENDIIENCINYTKLIINLVNPINVYLMIDGIAPMGKMNQQRERRYKSEFFKNVEVEKSILWDSNKITPGTNFMNKLNISLKNYKKTEMNYKIIISDSTEVGEGEHKIMNIIRNQNNNEKNIIYGLDADLVFLSILNKNSDNIVLIRDNTFSKFQNKNIDYLDIKVLKQYIYQDFMLILSKKDSFIFNKNNIIKDYVCLCFLLGNDFLEHLPSIYIKKSGIDTLMKAYSNAFNSNVGYLIKDSNEEQISIINLVYLKDIFYQLKNHENYFFKNTKVFDSLVKSDNDIYEKLKDSNNLYFYKDDLICYNKDNYRDRYYLFYNIYNINDSCLEYIKGLLWIYNYYDGKIINYSWYYKYHNVPFSNDLFDFLKSNHMSINLKCLMEKEDNTTSSIKQLCLVLPKESLLNILSELSLSEEELNKLKIYLEYSNYYPDKLYIDLFNKKYLWQSKLIFDFQKSNDNIINYFI